MPELSVRSFAQLIHLPAYAQKQILYQQKYPRRQPASFKAPYYRPALNLIRRYYSHFNNLATFPITEEGIPATGHKRTNNFQVIQAFRGGAQAPRQLQLQPIHTHHAVVGQVDCRVTPDVCATEGSYSKYIFYHFPSEVPDDEVIRTTVELVHLVLSANNIVCRLRDIEHVSIRANTGRSWSGKPRSTTLKRASATAAMIDALWPTL